MVPEQLLAELKMEIARLEAVAAELEGLVSEAVGLLGDVSDVAEDVRSAGLHDERKSHYTRIAEYLLGNGNAPRSASAIADATGISRSSLGQVLYRTHPASFVSYPMPGYSRKKLWALSEQAIAELQQPQPLGQPTLFGHIGDLAGVPAIECCARILKDHRNEPLSALTVAREALVRGYQGRARGSEDEVLLTTAKSFWAAMSRDSRFAEVRPLVFALYEQGQQPP
jgi:hypothetical protein